METGSEPCSASYCVSLGDDFIFQSLRSHLKTHHHHHRQPHPAFPGWLSANQSALSALWARQTDQGPDRRAQAYSEREAESARETVPPRCQLPSASTGQSRGGREGSKRTERADGALGGEGQELGIQTQLHGRPVSNEADCPAQGTLPSTL